MMSFAELRPTLVRAVALTAFLLVAPPITAQAPRVGPARGTLVIVGGGSMGPEIYRAFLDAAGGPEALVVEVPNAGGAPTYPQNGPGMRGWRQAGARNIHTLFTTDRQVAESDSFVAPLRRAGGVWFQGGRQYRLVDAYAGTRTEREFQEVLDRGGVIGGSSAGATIIGDFLVRGAPSNNNMIMHHPGYEKGFAYLRNVGIDQHVVARDRLPDFADSLAQKFPNLLGISEDEGTAWVVRGDTGTIIGRSKAFVYGGNDPNDHGKPFLTLWPGDVYDLGARRVLRRAIDGSPLRRAYVDSLFAEFSGPASGGATVLVAQAGKILVNAAYGIPLQPRLAPETTLPQFDVGDMVVAVKGLCEQLALPARAAADTQPQAPLQLCLSRGVSGPVGLRRTLATTDGRIQSSVDELYRIVLGLEQGTFRRSGDGDDAGNEPIDAVAGWQPTTVGAVAGLMASIEPHGKQGVALRIPDRQIAVLVLTGSPGFDAAGVATRIVAKLTAGMP